VRDDDAIERLLAVLAADPEAPSSVTDIARARDVHIADSLSGLAVAELAAARRIADIGSGAGFPGLPLAIALANAQVDLIEATGRKCAFMDRAIAAAGIANARTLAHRSEEVAAGEGRESYDIVTVRAVGRLSTLAELASPLLREGGVLIAWKGKRDPGEEAEFARAADALAMESLEVLAVGPYAGSRNRHLHTIRKSGPTPANLPRRPGIAKKRPLGAA